MLMLLAAVPSAVTTPIMRLSVLGLLAATLTTLTFVACDDATTPATSTEGDAGKDATSSPTEDASATDDGATSCDPPVNGTLQSPSGTFQTTIANTDGNLDKPAPGSIPCEAKFDPSSGISLGNNQYSGGFSITCLGGEGELYYGFMLNSFNKPKAGDSFPLGHVVSLAQGDGGYASNGQADFSWEEGPRCDTKQDKSKSWNAEQAAGTGGALVVDTLSGADMTFHITEINVTTSTNGLNYKGTGSFKVSGTGTVKMTGL